MFAKLSVAELVLETDSGNKRLAKQVVNLAGDVENESSIHAALMLYKAVPPKNPIWLFG